MPIWLIPILEKVIPLIAQMAINAYMRRKQDDDAAKIQAHQNVIASIKGPAAP